MNILIKNVPADAKIIDGILALLTELQIDWEFQQKKREITIEKDKIHNA